MVAVLAGFHYLWVTENFTIMGYTIPQNWNDEAMEYVNKLTDKINVGWDGEDYCLSDWNLRFLSRMNREVIKPRSHIKHSSIIKTLSLHWKDTN